MSATWQSKRVLSEVIRGFSLVIASCTQPYLSSSTSLIVVDRRRRRRRRRQRHSRRRRSSSPTGVADRRRRRRRSSSSSSSIVVAVVMSTWCILTGQNPIQTRTPGPCSNQTWDQPPRANHHMLEQLSALWTDAQALARFLWPPVAPCSRRISSVRTTLQYSRNRTTHRCVMQKRCFAWVRLLAWIWVEPSVSSTSTGRKSVRGCSFLATLPCTLYGSNIGDLPQRKPG